jgi:hypothetical protein
MQASGQAPNEDKTELFRWADETLPAWNPSAVCEGWVPTDFAVLSRAADMRKAVAEDVYRHLHMWEDLDAIYDGRMMQELDTWLSREHGRGMPLWQALMEAALREKQVWREGECNIYARPSLWLLRRDWMEDRFNDFVVERLSSRAFRDGNCEDRLIYLARASAEELAHALQRGAIDVADIPANRHADVRACRSVSSKPTKSATMSAAAADSSRAR